MNQVVMKQKANRIYEKNLKEVRQSFEEWRRTRQKMGPIPRELWDAAIELTKMYPKTVVCKSLRIGYRELKKKMAEYDLASKELEQTKGTEIESYFIEIPVCEPNRDDILEIEMENGCGARLKMRCPDHTLVKALGFWQVLLESQS